MFWKSIRVFNALFSCIDVFSPSDLRNEIVNDVREHFSNRFLISQVEQLSIFQVNAALGPNLRCAQQSLETRYWNLPPFFWCEMSMVFQEVKSLGLDFFLPASRTESSRFIAAPAKDS